MIRDIDPHRQRKDAIRSAVGHRRSEIERAVKWAASAHDRCRTDADKAAVLDVLVDRIHEIREGRV